MEDIEDIIEVTSSILEVGEARIVLEPSTRNYLFNGNIPRDIPIDYYQVLYQKFESNLLIQIKEGITIERVETYISRTKEVISNLISVSDFHRVNYVKSKNNNKLSEEAESTHDNIARIISTQKTVLNRILLKLYDVIDFVKEKVIDENKVMEENLAIETNLIALGHAGRATFRLSKKEALMLIFLLEENKIIEFEDRFQKIKFMENNFNYVVQSENHAKFNQACPMIGTGKEFTNFVSNDVKTIESNNKTLNKLQDKLEAIISDYEFVIRKYKKSE